MNKNPKKSYNDYALKRYKGNFEDGENVFFDEFVFVFQTPFDVRCGFAHARAL